MGEARNKSVSRKAILAGEPECIYCGEQATTVEHMPPVAMFKGKHRLSGFEFASCLQCNHSSRASDAAASFFARISPSNLGPKWEVDEAYRLIGTISQLAPKAIKEIFDPAKTKEVWTKGRDPLLSKMHVLDLDGKVTHSLMQAFGAKLGMGLFYKYCGQRMQTGGAIFSKTYFNSGLTRGEAEAVLSILPSFGELTQGRQRSGRQFNYRYNTDEKGALGALVAFHDNLFFRIFAFQEPDGFRDAVLDPDTKETRFGGLQLLAREWDEPQPT